MSDRLTRSRTKTEAGNGHDPDGAKALAAEGAPEDKSQKLEHPGIIVMRVPAGEGQERIEMVEVNGIDTLAVPSLLRMAANLKDQQLGISERR